MSDSKKNISICNWVKGIQEEIEDRTIFEITKHKIDKSNSKGNIGNHIQYFHFNIPANNRSEPDFLDKGIELKVTPMIEKRNDLLRSKERLVFGMINYSKIMEEEDFYSSSFMKKNKKTLIIFYIYDSNKSPDDFKIKKVNLINLLDLEEINQLEYDYKTIRDKIANGEAHNISSSDTVLLEACTKSSDSTHFVKQPKSEIKAKPRAFAFKNSFVTKIFYRASTYKFDNELSKIRDVINTINKYSNYSIDELKNIFDCNIFLKSDKFFVIKKILNVDKSFNIKALIDEDAIIKTINLESNFTLKEHIQLCRITLDSMCEDASFEDSEFYDIVANKKIIFVIFQKTKDTTILLKAIEYKFPPHALNHACEVFNHTKKLFIHGNAITKKEKGNDEYHFIKSSDKKMFHVRPGAKDGSDRYLTGFNESIIKQKFWLNKDEIVNFLKENKIFQ